jgi:3-oxoacyl-[acyl-carrier protein] reductase
VSPGRLAGKRAVVTGAARGIGAAIAETFERHGATVARLDVTEDDGIIGADLADPDAATAAATRAIDQLGGIDILVNNAGVLRMAPLLEITVEQWDSTFDVNVRAMLLTMQMAARSMIASGRPGTVINMASMGGKVGSPNQAHYAASKAAVIALTRVAAMELGPHHITVNCICPGYVLTEMGAPTRTQAMIDAWSATSPLGRLAQPADVANMALFLASEEASYCTGQAMNVTGGMIFH